MNFKEKLSPSAQKKLSDLLFILYAGGAALLSYSLVYALRKPFTAATFDGMELFGMDYKIATSIIQIFGYMVSKLDRKSTRLNSSHSTSSRMPSSA